MDLVFLNKKTSQFILSCSYRFFDCWYLMILVGNETCRYMVSSFKGRECLLFLIKDEKYRCF